MSTYFKKGAFNAICDICGRKYKSNQMKERWDGMMVCRQDFESRHPMDFFKARIEDLSIPWNRHEQSDVFVDVPFINLSLLPNYSPNTSNQRVPISNPLAPGAPSFVSWNPLGGWGPTSDT